jgi:small subunit ribosomal protein S8
VNDPISDMLTRIRNANQALLPAVEIPHSRMKESIAGILKREGYIADFAVEDKADVTKKRMKLKLKYQGKKSVIEGLRRISTPGLRRYVGSTEIPRVRGGLGVAVVSTSEGLMTDVQARKKNIGGELICYVW